VKLFRWCQRGFDLKKFIVASLAAGLCLPSLAFAQLDTDGDGIPNDLDSYPCDANASGQLFVPGQGSHGMLQFEDFFPTGLDEDFNDVVVAYNVVYTSNSAGLVSQLRLTLNVLAAGGRISHGMGFALPVARTNVQSATLTVGSGMPSALTLSTQDANATMVLTNDLRASLFSTSNLVVNADPNSPTLSSQTMQVDVQFATPVALLPADAPHDVYIFQTQAPGAEVHSLKYCGTANMNTALFNTGIDASNPGGRGCFVDNTGLPWVLSLPEVVDYPSESVRISSLYPQIAAWAASGGTSNQSFYLSPVTSSAYPTPLTPSFIAEDSIIPDVSCLPVGICNSNGVQDGSETGIDCGPGCAQSCLRVVVEGHADVVVGCDAGDYSCQAHLVCNAVTGYQCVHQAYECYRGSQGSWYPPDGQSGSSQFNFAYAYDFGAGGTSGGYGNICACNASQMTTYGLASNHTNCGLGHWGRVGTVQTCTDGLLNQDEVLADCGGSCGSCVGTCNDGIQNQGETQVDCGGPLCGACPTCSDGIQNQGETQVDCGGTNCTACPTCSDGIRNQGEIGVDCGGPCMASCPGLPITVEGIATPVYVNCANGDFSCQAKGVCEAVTGITCVHQAYDCYRGNQGSWYPQDGASGSSQFNFAYAYDFGAGGTTGGYGNICACNSSQMARYGLASNHTNCGLGHWVRVP